jgi:hypothetical protein
MPPIRPYSDVDLGLVEFLHLMRDYMNHSSLKLQKWQDCPPFSRCAQRPFRLDMVGLSDYYS